MDVIFRRKEIKIVQVKMILLSCNLNVKDSHEDLLRNSNERFNDWKVLKKMFLKRYIGNFFFIPYQRKEETGQSIITSMRAGHRESR